MSERTRDRLASELRKVAAQASVANAAKYEAFAKRALTGEFDDYADTYVCPITQLHSELTAAGFTKFAARVADGEFDASKAESDEWARSPSGQDVLRRLGPEMRKLQKIGRLALRHEGENWNAYYAMPDTMDGAIPVGSIRIAAVDRNPERKQAFMDMMRDVVADIIEETTGQRPSWPDEPQAAPESERAGHA